jgi:hypothetical protein
VVDPETGHVVPRGQTGELKTRGYCVMKGNLAFDVFDIDVVYKPQS